VDMAKNVAHFINARVQAVCECGLMSWHPSNLIGDGAVCSCGLFIESRHITKSGEQAKQLDGDSPDRDRQEVYRAHQSGSFQFLSVCGLCREGYNDPDIACVAVFRPVSKKASALAEQMKGRSCRPLRSIAKMLHTLPDAAARVKAIADSAKPNALIIDLVGITGLADCASTIEIYADGLPDEIKQRAEEILTAAGLEGEANVEDAIAQAKQEAADAKESARLEREAAERSAAEEFKRRAEADARAKYEAKDVGYGSNVDPDMASDAQYKFMAFLGMQIDVAMHKKKAGRIISQLRLRVPPSEVARTNRLEEGTWQLRGPSLKAIGFAKWKSVPYSIAKSGYDLSLLIDAKTAPQEFARKRRDEIAKARKAEDLDAIGKDLAIVSQVLPRHLYEAIVQDGRSRRLAFSPMPSNEPIPD
jgi:hypothetical protein